MKKPWKDVINGIDYAFQSIVNIHTGVCYGVEALIRGQERVGFNLIGDVFDKAFEEKILFPLDLFLRKKALTKFCTIPFYKKIKLFYNLDNRVLIMPDYTPGFTSGLLQEMDLNQNYLCFEISERHKLVFGKEIEKAFNAYKKQAYQIAIDDFGTGFSGLQLLYHLEPDFLKIDRFFIAEIEKDPRKKLFVSNIIKLAHILGIQVIAEGVETEKEFSVCHEIGCDYVQGFLILHPTLDMQAIPYYSEQVVQFNRLNQRNVHSDHKLISNKIEYIHPVRYPDQSVADLFEAFRKPDSRNLVPVVNRNQEPMGIVKEKELKEYVYSPYGKDLIRNQRLGLTTLHFMTKTPKVDITTEIEEIIEICTRDEKCEAVLVTENGRYVGVLNMLALLNLINEKNLALARDQNPLTKLPGNTIINAYLAKALENVNAKQMFIYFDFDNFKPFNDKYGFRIGDRAILLFSDVLKKISNKYGMFIGHIGGDDFFASFSFTDDHIERNIMLIQEIINDFREDAVNFYDDVTKQAGYMTIKNREEKLVRVPLLSVSAAVLIKEGGRSRFSIEEIAQTMAAVKKKVKESRNKLAIFSLEENEFIGLNAYSDSKSSVFLWGGAKGYIPA